MSTIGSGCEICGGQGCVSHPEIDHLDTYPFLPGGRPAVPGREGFEWVPAPYPLHHETLEVIEYGIGDRVPMDIAVARGIATGPLPEPPPAEPKGRRR
jgi:hypothetical protein